jgi:hypothetical protein
MKLLINKIKIMKKILLILFVFFGLQAQSQVIYCDSVSISISGSTPTTVTYTTLANPYMNTFLYSFDINWNVTNFNTGAFITSDTAYNPTFTLNNLDTVLVCATAIITGQGMTFTCIMCDTILYNGGWMMMSMGQTPPNECDSVIVSFNQIDTTTTPDLIYFDVQVFGYGPSVGYPGFVLLNSVGDTIAYENFNTALNVFTLMANTTETRSLEVVQNFSLPFSGVLHLMDSWFAGNPVTACIYPFNISIGTTDINEIINKRKVLKVTDILGREIKVDKNKLLFYIYNDGTVEKRITIE